MQYTFVRRLRALLFVIAGGTPLVGHAAWPWSSPQPASQYAWATPPGHGTAPVAPAWHEKLTAPLSPSWWSGKPPASQVAAGPTIYRDSLALQNDPGPPSPELYVGMAAMAIQTGHADQARALYQHALEGDRNHYVALTELARLEDREGRFAVADNLYQEALRRHPGRPALLNDFALCLARQQRYAEAYPLLREAINRDPKKVLYRNNMATMLVAMNRIDEAAANLRSVHAPAAAQFNLGVLLEKAGRHAEAQQSFAAAFSLDPSLAQAWAPAAESVAVAARSLPPGVMTAPRQQGAATGLQVSSESSVLVRPPRLAPIPDDSILPTPPTEHPTAAEHASHPVGMDSAGGPVLMPSADPPASLPPVE